MTIAFTILGEAASKANSRELFMVGPKDRRRPLFAKSAKAREYERAALLQIPLAARAMLEGDVSVTLRVFYASRQSDLDESVILDVLQAKFSRDKMTGKRKLVRRGVYVNDRQVKEKHVYWGLDRAAPRAEVEVAELGPAQLRLE